MTGTLGGRVALITGGASGIGAGVARRLAASGARVVIADVDAAGGRDVAAGIDGRFIHTDVSRLEDNLAAVAAAVAAFGRLDIAFLNAGVTGEANLLEDFDACRYQRLRAVNLDGVVYGVHAARRQLARGRFAPLATAQGASGPETAAQRHGTIIVTASLAGLFESPVDPLYAATKHAVVGLVRSLAHIIAPQGITINALCPTLVDTPMLGDALPHLVEAGLAVLDVERVADAVEAIIAGGGTGQAWPVLPHDASAPFAFPSAPNLMATAIPGDAEVPR